MVSSRLWQNTSSRTLPIKITKINEFNTEGERGSRIKCCYDCNTYYHRDLMTSENIAIIPRSMLLKQNKPEYCRDTK